MATIEKRQGKNGITYKAIIRIKGFPIQRQTFKRLTDARLWSQQQETDIRRGDLQANATTARNKSLKQVIERYRSDVLPNKAESTQRGERTYLNYWEDVLGDYGLNFIEPDKISHALRKLSKAGNGQFKDPKVRTRKPKSRKTIKQYRACLELLFKYARQWRWTKNNPLDGVEKITKIRNDRVRFLSDAERTDLLTACKASSNQQLYPIVVFALSTGARKGEILGLTLSDINLTRGVAILRDTKNTDTRAVPVVQHIKTILKGHIKNLQKLYKRFKTPPAKQWLFPRGDGRAPIDIRSSWVKARDKAEIEDFRFHDLRHSTASYLAMGGATQLEIAEVLGHRTLEMVKRYSHLSEQHTIKIVSRMNKQIFAN